jgi:hypothetical protein
VRAQVVPPGTLKDEHDLVGEHLEASGAKRHDEHVHVEVARQPLEGCLGTLSSLRRVETTSSLAAAVGR